MNHDLNVDVPGPGDEGVPWPLRRAEATLDDHRPVTWSWALELVGFTLRDLVGRRLRVSTGMHTQDIDPGRVTVVIDDDERIRDIWVDPELAAEGSGNHVPWPAGEGRLADTLDSRPVVWPWARLIIAVTLKDLIGRKLRVSDSNITGEVDPGRLTILVDEQHCISEVWVDASLATD